jgi:hypothetical protein
MSKVEMNDATAMHLRDRALEIGEERRRQLPRQRAGEQNAGAILENQGLSIEIPKQAWNRLYSF